MANELFRDEFGAVIHHVETDVLELHWLEGTAGMSDEDFRRWLTLFAAHGEQVKPTNMLIDATKFQFAVDGASTGPWRDENIIPRYNSAGVQKMAFLLPEGAAPGSEPAPEGPANFPTAYFDTAADVQAWFAS